MSVTYLYVRTQTKSISIHFLCMSSLAEGVRHFMYVAVQVSYIISIYCVEFNMTQPRDLKSPALRTLSHFLSDKFLSIFICVSKTGIYFVCNRLEALMAVHRFGIVCKGVELVIFRRSISSYLRDSRCSHFCVSISSYDLVVFTKFYPEDPGSMSRRNSGIITEYQTLPQLQRRINMGFLTNVFF